MTDTTTRPKQVRAPARILTALESRALGERLMMVAADPWLGRLPRGDGHTVLVLPGFLADDGSTNPLRDLLVRLGYHTRGWGLGTNVGPTAQIIDGLLARFREMTADGRRMTIVGWSLGGIFGRELARLAPERVRQVVTLGSPIHMFDGDRSRASHIWDRLAHLHGEFGDRRVRERERGPLPVPTTSVYTRTDGIVHWSSCLIEKGSQAENVEVRGSHCGLGFNPSAVAVVADRLAQPDGTWRPFRPPLWARGAYPRPSDRRPGW